MNFLVGLLGTSSTNSLTNLKLPSYKPGQEGVNNLGFDMTNSTHCCCHIGDAQGGNQNTLPGQGNQGEGSNMQFLASLLKSLFDMISAIISLIAGGQGGSQGNQLGLGGSGNPSFDLLNYTGNSSTGGNTGLDPIASGGSDWMKIARGEMGVSEATHNSRIASYHKTTGLNAGGGTPWCSSFVNAVMEKAGYKGTDSAASVSWKTWGQGVSLNNARQGDIVVFDKDNNNSDATHVGFIQSIDLKRGIIMVLGGNQSNQVKVSQYSISDWPGLAIRRPTSREARVLQA